VKFLRNETRTLLAAHNTREQLRSGQRKGLPIVVGLSTLFFSGYFEKFLHGDAEGRYLYLYFVLATAAFSITTLISFTGGSEEILRKSSIFPLVSWSRFSFVLFAALGSPMMLAFWLAGALALVVIFSSSVLLALTCVLQFTVMAATTAAVTVIAILMPYRRLQTSAPLRTLLPLLLLILVISTSVMDARASMLIPIVGWAATGVRSAMAGDHGGNLLTLGASSAVFVCMIFLGRKAC